MQIMTIAFLQIAVDYHSLQQSSNNKWNNKNAAETSQKLIDCRLLTC